jgi:glutamate/tyrosine decarboxylase-like PLP-dependent enzyme
MASRLSSEEGVHVLNDVVLNQVIVEFGWPDADAETRKTYTQAVIDAALESGSLFVAGARWRDIWVMRISVMSYLTTIEDGNIAVDAIVKAWKKVRSQELNR